MTKENKKRETKKGITLVLALAFIILLIGSAGYASAVSQIPSSSLCGTSDCGTCQPQPVCGDGTCNGAETCLTCSCDCGTCQPPQPRCGDNICNNGETCTTCAGDCGTCPSRWPSFRSEACGSCWL